MARFRAIISYHGYYIIEKHHWLFGWIKYDDELYTAQEAKQRLMDIEKRYPNIHPINKEILKEIKV